MNNQLDKSKLKKIKVLSPPKPIILTNTNGNSLVVSINNENEIELQPNIFDFTLIKDFNKFVKDKNINIEDGNIIIKLNELSNKVFDILGTSHTEYIYHRALSMELQKLSILHEMEKRTVIMYETFTLGEERIDIFLTNNNMIVELKAITAKPREPEFAQIRKYYRQFKQQKINVNKWGIIINFPQPSVNKQINNNIDIILICFEK